MNAQLEAKLLKAQRQPVRLAPIPWGKPDPSLATGVMHSLARTTPPHAIPFNTALNRRLREFLRSHGFAR